MQDGPSFSRAITTLIAILGRELTAHIGGVRDADVVDLWIAGIPDPGAEKRLRLAHSMAMMLCATEQCDDIQAWFLFPQQRLGNRSPALVIREDGDRNDVIAVIALSAMAAKYECNAPVGDSTLNLSYDYRSDGTTVASGDPTAPFVSGDPISSLGGYSVSIPTTVARNFDWSASYAAPLTSRLRLFIGDYYTVWKLNYGIITTYRDFTAFTAALSTKMADHTYRHDDPHAGLTWHPERNTNYRFTVGSAVTVPYAALVSGGPDGNNAFTPAGTLTENNPDLEPESTVAYNAGFDHRLLDGSVIAADVFSNTIYNVFATQVTPFNGAALGYPPSFSNIYAATTEPVNAPLERSYGLELSITHAPTSGVGYHIATTFQRAYLSGLPASFYGSVSSLLNGKQLDGRRRSRTPKRMAS